MARYINPFTDFKILTESEISALKKEERKAYELSLKHMRDYNNTVNFAREEGREEGIALVIKNMKANGISTDVISKMTGLSKETIESL